MEDNASDSRPVWKLATIAFGMIALGACAYSFVLYSEFSTELAAARNEADLAHQEVITLRSQLSSMQAQADADQLALQSKHEHQAAAQSTRDLPIELSFQSEERHGRPRPSQSPGKAHARGGKPSLWRAHQTAAGNQRTRDAAVRRGTGLAVFTRPDRHPQPR